MPQASPTRDKTHSQDQLRISGSAEVVTDESTLAEIWAGNPLLKQYLGTPENPEFILYRIVPVQVRFMREWALDYHQVPTQPT
jgi:general stress protein 26